MLLVAAALTISSVSVIAHGNKSNDSTVSIRVGGACEMCKDRIEKTLKIRGVRSADWNIDSKMLTLVYDPGIISLSKVNKIIAEAGHDTELEKAKDAIYNELPACCHYRKKEAGGKSQEVVNTGIPGKQNDIIKGVVLEEDKKGSFKPLSGASVIWAGTNKGTYTDSLGIFFIQEDDSLGRLIISYTGYTADTITITDTKELKIILASGKQLNEIKVYAKQRSTYLSALTPIRTQVMTERELFKAACCNLSESFETNPSVDVSYNDAVTGSKQIQLLVHGLNRYN